MGRGDRILQGEFGFADASHALNGGDSEAIVLLELGVELVQFIGASNKFDNTTAGQVLWRI